MIYLTFDLETENHESKKRKASPFDPRNYIVQIGWSVNGGKNHEKYYDAWHRDHVLPDVIDEMGEGDWLVGFNIKFDLLWVWDDPRLQAALKRGVQIYCGQYMEYLLGGATQDVQMISMNQTVEQYGGSQKIDAVKEMWEEGYLTSQIPRNLLTDYLVGDGDEIDGDITNTWKIFKGQVARAKAEHPVEFMQMFKFRMDGLLSTIEMEYNGVYCDKAIGVELRKDLVQRLSVAKEELEAFIPELPEGLVFNWNSNVHKSSIIFGGTVKYQKWVQHLDDDLQPMYAKKTEKWPIISGIEEPVNPKNLIKAGAVYVLQVPEANEFTFEHKGKFYMPQEVFQSGKRKGEAKTKNVQVPDPDKPKGAKKDHYFTFKGYTKPDASWQGEATDAYDNPLYSVGSKVIEKLAERGLPFTDALVKHTAMEKDLGTYYWSEDKKGNKKGMLTLLDDNNIIHHKINHTSTVTTRLSSSDPNLQNIPRGDKSDVKRMFRSRFGNDGKMAEIDYSQLEVVIQGMLSEDPQLTADLQNRVDFHCKRLSAKLNEDYESVWKKCHKDEDPEYKKMRTNAKIFSFQRAYGAGVDTIAKETGMARSEVEELVQAEERLYPGVVAFDQMLEKHIIANRSLTENKLFIGGAAFTQGEAFWDAPTGTRFVWREGITPEFMHAKGKYTGFSPTERKNYPMQGVGGEVVQMMLGKLYRWLLANDHFNGNIRLVNTVHDCVWLDGKKDLIEKVALKAQEILESVPAVMNAAYPKMNVVVPFPCETEVGNDMYDMTVVHA